MAPVQVQSSEPSLLVLPAVTLWASYRETFETLLPKIAPSNKRSVSCLDVAIVLPKEWQGASRSTSYSRVQKMFKDCYSLICQCAARKGVELDFPGGIDARIFLIEKGSKQEEDVDQTTAFSGPVIDLTTFVASKRPYNAIYSVEGEEGEGTSKLLIETWQEMHRIAPELKRLPSGPSMTAKPTSPPINPQHQNSPPHSNVAVGGTFDHLHIGHKLLLSLTIFLGSPHPSHPRTITIGITGDALLVNKKHASQVESWQTRQQTTSSFLDSILLFHPDPSSVRKTTTINDDGPNGQIVRVMYGDQVTINYTRIEDPFGPTITDENITALVISHETRAGGKAVNDKREEKGWKGLEVFEVEVLDAGVSGDEDGDEGADEQKDGFESKISSTEIRRRLGEMAKI